MFVLYYFRWISATKLESKFSRFPQHSSTKKTWNIKKSETFFPWNFLVLTFRKKPFFVEHAYCIKAQERRFKQTPKCEHFREKLKIQIFCTITDAKLSRFFDDFSHHLLCKGPLKNIKMLRIASLSLSRQVSCVKPNIQWQYLHTSPVICQKLSSNEIEQQQTKVYYGEFFMKIVQIAT